MSGIFELILWALGAGVVWVVISAFIKVSYDNGYSDGLKEGAKTGKAHAKYEIKYKLEQLSKKDESIVHILSYLSDTESV
jgi:hypothetical protein